MDSINISTILPQDELTYVYPCPSKVEPLHEPPNAIKENGREFPFSSFKQLESPFFANDVFPIPGEPSNPKQYPVGSPLIHWQIIFNN